MGKVQIFDEAGNVWRGLDECTVDHLSLAAEELHDEVAARMWADMPGFSIELRGSDAREMRYQWDLAFASRWERPILRFLHWLEARK